MSYTRSFNRSISVSIPYNYPASESGGSGTVHDVIPVTINIYVDTVPFDASIDTATASVDLLTGSVIAMEAAQVESIRENAEAISNKLTSNFFNLIKSDLSVQRTETKTLLNSRFFMLKEYADAVESTKARMESDTARIRTHYYTVFHDIDTDMEKRIEEIDGTAFNLIRASRNDLIDGPGKKLIPFSTVVTSETEKVESVLTTATLRKKLSTAISNIFDYVSKSNKYKKSLSEIITDERSDKPIREYIPAVIFKEAETNDGDENAYICEVSTFGNGSDVMMKLREFAAYNSDGKWHMPDSSYIERIDKAFMGYAESLDERGKGDEEYKSRVSECLLKMWNQNKDEIKVLS